MKLLHFLKSLFWATVLAFIITEAIAGWYIDELKHSGGFVTAKDLVGAPWLFAVVAFGGTITFMSKK